MKLPIFLNVTLLAAVAVAADGGGAAPATITKESDLVVLTLKPDAVKSLRLKTVKIEKRQVADTRLFSGEVVTPLAENDQQVAPVLGGTLDEVLKLADFQAAADGRVLQAQVQLDASNLALERAQKVLNAEAGSLRSVDEAKAAQALAQAALTTAKTQRNLLGTAVGGAGTKRAWVRVAIYSGEAPLLDPKAPASVRTLNAAKPQSTEPVAGPQTANALTNTLDWYYALPAEMNVRAGERVAVEIPTLAGQGEHLVLPFNAVLHDIHGGQWIYAKTAENTFSRRRIQVARLAGKDAVLASGPPVGTEIVTDGSAELFGTEFMTGK